MNIALAPLARPTALVALLARLAVAMAAPGAEKAAPVHVVDGAFVTNWLVLGPVPGRGLDADFLAEAGGEANVRPREGDTILMKGGEKLVWTRLESNHEVIDLELAFGMREWSVAYAYCELSSQDPVETDAQADSAFPIGLWLNGKRVSETTLKRTRTDDLHPVVPIGLLAGRNACLLKIRVESGPPWAFSFRPLPAGRATTEIHIRSPEGQPLPGALVQFYDEGEPVARLRADAAGRAEACLFPLAESYDLRLTSGQLGTWLHAVALRPGERRKLEAVLTDSVSISGRVLARDGSPQNAIVVQALRVSDAPASQARPPLPRGPGFASEPRLNTGESVKVQSLVPLPAFSDTVLSDTNGFFRFVNLRPGRYGLRAHGLHGYVYPGAQEGPEPSSSIEVIPGRTHDRTRFVVAEIKKGVWSASPIKKGLTDPPPARIHRTPDGVLWVGTDLGSLHSYDGSQFQLWDSPLLARDGARVIGHDSAGGLWIGTKLGLGRLVGNRIEPLVLPDASPRKEVNFILADPDGALWFSTSFGLCKYDGRQVTRWTPQEGAPGYETGALARAQDGGLWLTTSRSLARFDGRVFSEPVRLSGVRAPPWDRLHQAKDGAIWFCSPIHEVAAYRYDGKTLSRLGEAEGLSSFKIQNITETSDGVLWFATDKGLSRFDGTTIVNYTTADGLSGEDVRDVRADSDDVLWCAAAPGVSRFDTKGFTGFTLRDGLTSKTGKMPGVFAIEPDAKGGYLIGTEWGGVYHLGGAFPFSLTNCMLPEAYVRHIHRASDGTVWLGTSDGIYKQENGRAIKVLERSWIIALNSDLQGRLWFGQGWIGGGLSSYNPRTREEAAFTRAQGLPDDSVWAIERAADGGLWIGTSGGLAEFRDGRIESVGERLRIPSGAVMGLRRDEDGALWIGGDSGLHRLQGTNLFSLVPSKGVPVDALWCSAKTADGILWMGTDKNGLLGYDGQTVTMLDKRDGLLGNRVFALRPESDGSLLIGFVEGGLMRYRRTRTAPSVHLRELKLDNRTFSAFTNLPATEIGRHVSVQYQEMDLKTHLDKRQFRYRVEGPSGEVLFTGVTKDRWFEWTPQKGGAYTFEVQAIDRDLNYSEPARLAFRAMVPWHANAWIVAAFLSLPGGLLIWAFIARALYLRQSREAAVLRERVRISRDLHDHLGAGLTDLALAGDLVRQHLQQSGAAHILAARLSASARELTRTLGEVIWMTDPEKDTLRSFVSFASSYAERFFSGSPLRLRFEIPAELPDLFLPAGLRRSLFMVVKEAFNNVAKHAEASELCLKLDLAGRELRLSIEDNGRGFVKTAVAAECHGLANMQQRLREWGGQLECASAPGQGTRVYARLPLPKK